MRLSRTRQMLIAVVIIPIVLGIAIGTVLTAAYNNKVSAMQEDLQRSGFQVVSIYGGAEQATLRLDGGDITVRLRNDDGDVGWYPYGDCPMLPDGSFSPMQCLSPPSPN